MKGKGAAEGARGETGAHLTLSTFRRYPHTMRYCPCLKPATDRIWEADLHLCRFHVLRWLNSPEKQRCVDDKGNWLAGEAPQAVQDFAARIWRELPLRTRIWRRLSMAWKG